MLTTFSSAMSTPSSIVGEQYSNGNTTLAISEGEATLQEGGAVQFAKCKLESAP